MSEQNDDSQISLSFIESDDDDEETDLVEIKLSSAILKIKFVKFYEYSLLFRNKYITKESRNNLSDDILQFQRQCNINESNMIIFFELIQDKSVTITRNNYFDLRKISKYFQVKKLQKLLDNYSKSQFLGIEFLISQILEQNQIENNFNGQYSIDDEAINMLSQEVNQCLQSELFEKLPIQKIYHIISKSDKNTLSSDLLYDFISKSIEERHFLFHFLSVGKLSDEKLNAIFENENWHLFTQHIPADLGCIIRQRNENKNLKLERSEFQKQVSELNAQNGQLQSNILNLNTENNQLKSKISELNAQNGQLQSKISELNAQNGQLQSNILNLNTEKSQLQSQLQRLERILYLKHLNKFDMNNPFNGIISCLKDRWGENVFEHLEIKSSSTFSYRLIPQNVINYDPISRHFCSKNIENSWISFDFKKYRIVPTSYVLQRKKNKVYPINWSIEVSNDNENWESIDEQVDCQLLRDFQIHNFEVNSDVNNDKSFRYIRMKMNGKTINDSFMLIIQAFEIYGNLISYSD